MLNNYAHRRTLGISMIVAGLIPWIALTVYIVQIKHPSMPVLVAYVLSWVVFFVGKTILKTPEPRFDPADGPPAKD